MTRKIHSLVARRASSLAAACLMALLCACAGRQHVREGDRLLKAGQYGDAIAAYEEALKDAPDSADARRGIRSARREAVRVEIERAEGELSAGRFAGALGSAMRARAMPLDLEDVDLVRRIDDTIARSARLAEDEVQKLVQESRFIEAVDLTSQIVDASPGIDSRQQWAEEVRAAAIKHYTQEAVGLESSGLLGSSAIQLALAKRSGAPVPAERVAALWGRFAEPTCFSAPEVQVTDKSAKAGDLAEKIKATARIELDAVRSRCGEGTRPLAVAIHLIKVELVDKTETSRAARPLPGADVKTEEEYFEEVPVTVVEDVTEYETRSKVVERRDCAPRPGQQRGCRTWAEEVEEKIPVQRKREVQKVERIRKTRPVKGPLPEDKVLSYEVTSVTRRALYQGTIDVRGGAKAKPFLVRIESTDVANEAASKAGLAVPKDPLEVRAMDEVVREANDRLAESVRLAVGEAVQGWSQDFQKEAQRAYREGQWPQAEEQFLKLLALGASSDQTMARFFQQRYGRSVGSVMDMLATALGRTPPPRPVSAGRPGEREELASFPTARSGEAGLGEDARDHVSTHGTGSSQREPIPSKTPDPPKGQGLSEEELKALEQESIDATDPRKPAPVEPGTPAPPAAEEAQTDAPPG